MSKQQITVLLEPELIKDVQRVITKRGSDWSIGKFVEEELRQIDAKDMLADIGEL